MLAWLLISFFVLLFMGVPIALSLGLSAMGGILCLGGGSTVTIAQRMFEGMNSFAPVSYTHLDVYKRQGLHRAARKVLGSAHRRSTQGFCGERSLNGHKNLCNIQ